MSFRGEVFCTSAVDGSNGRAPGYLRQLGAQERLLHLYSIDHPRHFCVVAEIAGHPAGAKLQMAFDKVQRRHLLLNVEIVDNSRTGPAFYAIDRQIEPKIERLDSADDWKRAVEDELARPLNGSPGPLMRATVLYHTSGAQVILTFHHAIADGLSAAFILRDLMVALSGSELHSLPQPWGLSAEAAMGRDTGGSNDLSTAADAQRLVDIGKRPLWRRFEGDKPKVSTMTLDEGSTRKIREISKANGTTVHGALCAAIALSALAESGADEYTIINPINLREILQLQTGECGLYVGLGTVRIKNICGRPFWEVARQATDELKFPRSVAGVMASMDMLAANIPRDASPDMASGILGSFQYDAVVSNLGKLPIPEAVGDLRLTGFWGPMVQGRFKYERVFGAATVGDRLRIVQTNPHYMTSLLDRIGERLNAM